MKRYIKSDTQYQALVKLQKEALSQGLKAKVNKLYHCVDVFDESGNIIEQRYAQELPERSSQASFRYKYVGQGNGDYIREDYETHRRQYSDKDPYIKYIHRTTQDMTNR